MGFRCYWRNGVQPVPRWLRSTASGCSSSAKISADSTARGPGRLIPDRCYASPGHAVADPALVDDPGRADGLIAEPVAQPLDVGAHELGLAVAPSDPDLAQQSLVRQDQAGLNYGDCFAYALARQLEEPLLCKGDDFSQTDLALL